MPHWRRNSVAPSGAFTERGLINLSTFSDGGARAVLPGLDRIYTLYAAYTATGQQVLAVLGKRRTDVTEEDADVMRAVVDRVRRERGDDPEPVAGDDGWRHSLMSLGHDPLKAR